MNEEKAFQNKIRVLNPLLILCVVVMHANSLYLYPDIAGTGAGRLFAAFENFVCYNLCEAAVPLLFAISGFLFYRGLTTAGLRGKLLRRAKSLLAPYLIWNALYFLLFTLAGRLSIPGMLTEKTALTAAGVLKGLFLYGQNPSAWFLLQLILFAAASPLLLPILRDRLWGAALLCGAFALAILLPDAGYLRTDALVYYLAGAFAARHWEGFVTSRGNAKRILAGAALFLAYEGGMALNAFTSAALPNVVLRLPLLVSVWLMADVFGFENKKPLFSGSFFVYLTHLPVLGALRLLLYALLPKGLAGAVLTFLLTPLPAVLVCTGAAKLLKKSVPALYGLLAGGRD